VLYQAEGDGVAAALVDTTSAGMRGTDYVTTANDSQARVDFDNVRVPKSALVGEPARGAALARDLCDYAAALMTSQLAGATRRDMEFAVEYAGQREAFGQPIGAFQAIQHLCADMLIAVDGAQLLVHEALWRLDQGLPASIEVSQAKAFAGDKCIFVARSAQQIHGGIGFMMEFDLQLWYRRIVAWSLRCGSVREHRQQVAAALLEQPGKVRLGMPLVPA
jgi:alkylation response protein AidB-like acyl-CoA dehydrogenase